MRRQHTRLFPDTEIGHVLNGGSLADDYWAEIDEFKAVKCDYERDARRWLWRAATAMRVSWVRTGYMPWDESGGPMRDIYSVTIYNKRGSYTFDFGASIMDTKDGKFPTAYDVLACLNPFDADNFTDIDDMAATYGIEKPSRAIQVWQSMQDEARAFKSMFGDDQLEKLTEIQ